MSATELVAACTADENARIVAILDEDCPEDEQEAEELIALYDVDLDGSLSASELEAAMNSGADIYDEDTLEEVDEADNGFSFRFGLTICVVVITFSFM